MINRNLKVSGLLAVLMTTTSAAFAADILYPPPPPPPVTELRTSIHDWSGPYAGAEVGVVSLHALYLPSVGNDPELSGDSVSITGLAGYNLQYDNIVIGVEGDISLTNLKARNRLDEVALKVPYIATARLRMGYALDNTLFFATAGLGVLRGEMTLTAFNQTDKKTHYGYVIGGGIETAVWDNLNVRLEYLYGDFGKKTYSFTPGDVTADINSVHMVRAGLIYNFDPNG